jgi:hypothetical protein
MTNSTQGNQKLMEVTWPPAAIPKSVDWWQKVVALGRRLSEKLRAANSSNGGDDHPVDFGMW